MSGDTTQEVQLQLERAQALVALGRSEEAVSMLHQLIASEPEIAPAWCLLAQAQGGVGDAQAALAAAERATALAPENDWPHRLRSAALQQLGDLDGAIAAAREAVAADPDNWRTHRRLAICMIVAKRDAGDALQAAERAVALAPNEPSAHHTLGAAHEMRGNHDEADRCFRQALALDPQYSPAHDALAHRQLAASGFGRAGNLAAAATGFRDAVRADPRADDSATNVERVLQVFIARLSYLIFLIVWLGSRIRGDTLGARIAPLLLLAVPAAFAVRFLSRLAPDLRKQTAYVAFHGKLAASSIAQTVAVALLILGAVAPGEGRSIGLGLAVLSSLCARLLLPRRRSLLSRIRRARA